MKSSPKISVITGYYNRPKVVRRTIESLLNQSLRDIEILIFDDCSKDNTAQVIADLCCEYNDDRLVPIYHEKNTGFTRGLIEAIQKSRGEYIAIQGSGDVSLPARLELQAKALDENPDIGVVGCYFRNYDEAGVHYIARRPDASRVTLDSLRANNVFAHGEVMIRRSFYEQVGGYRPIFRFSADYDLWLRLIRISKFHTVPDFLYDRYMLRDGVSYNPDKAIHMVKYHALGWQISHDESLYQEIVKKYGETIPVDEVLPDDNYKVQKKLLRLALRFTLFGDRDEAAHVGFRLKSVYARNFILLSNWLTRYWPFSVMLRVVQRLMKIDSKN